MEELNLNFIAELEEEKTGGVSLVKFYIFHCKESVIIS